MLALNSRRTLSLVRKKQSQTLLARYFSSVSVPLKLNLESQSPTLQEARSWDAGVESNFSVSTLSEIFKDKKVVIFGVPGAFTGVCTKAHVPGYLSLLPQLKAKGVDSVICTAVNDPYTLHAWATQMGAHKKIDFYADFSGEFHKSLGLSKDLSAALLGSRSERWSAFVDNGTIKILNVEKSPSELELSSGEQILKDIGN